MINNINKYDSILSTSNSDSSLNESESETDEDDFDPGLFGLLDNPGVVRFDCVDYPLAVTEYSDDEYLAAINLDINTAWDIMEDINSDSKILSRSVDDINNTTFYTDLPLLRTFNFSKLA